jgi:4a-hydroxytetrahydrobiopterin dehydratase
MKLYTEEEIKKLLPAWNFRDNGIEKDFEFRDFKDAFCFMTKIAFHAEVLDHHPDWSNVYNRVFIRLNTHSHSGVTEKDLELAGIIDKI